MKGDLFSAGSETGELIEVASAKRGIRGPFWEDDVEEEEELESVLVALTVTEAPFFSEESVKSTACDRLFPLTISTGETGSNGL